MECEALVRSHNVTVFVKRRERSKSVRIGIVHGNQLRQVSEVGAKQRHALVQSKKNKMNEALIIELICITWQFNHVKFIKRSEDGGHLFCSSILWLASFSSSSLSEHHFASGEYEQQD
jgi:hypothetical protein